MGREIYFDGVRKVRDLGGLKTRDGKTIRQRQLIRSAMLSKLRPDDIGILKYECRVSKVIDLRTKGEIEEEPDIKVNGVRYYSVPIFEGPVSGISHEKNTETLKELNGMAGLYQQMVLNQECRNNIRKVLVLIMGNDFESGSVLWHCTEGKDRCGIISAAILCILGVDIAQIREDYLLTNVNNAPKAQRYYEAMIEAGKSEQEAGYVRDMYLAKEEYFDAALEAIDKVYGSLGEYLAKGLNIPEALLLSFRNKVLE